MTGYIGWVGKINLSDGKLFYKLSPEPHISTPQ